MTIFSNNIHFDGFFFHLVLIVKRGVDMNFLGIVNKTTTIFVDKYTSHGHLAKHKDTCHRFLQIPLRHHLLCLCLWEHWKESGDPSRRQCQLPCRVLATSIELSNLESNSCFFFVFFSVTFHLKNMTCLFFIHCNIFLIPMFSFYYFSLRYSNFS